MYTEDQAKDKWCPNSRVGLYVDEVAVAVNRNINDGTGTEYDVKDDTRCRASDCMFWRWDDKRFKKLGLAPEHKDKNKDQLPPVEKNQFWQRSPDGDWILCERVGYCGAAGAM